MLSRYRGRYRRRGTRGKDRGKVAEGQRLRGKTEGKRQKEIQRTGDGGERHEGQREQEK
jgi:hypothetical protein